MNQTITGEALEVLKQLPDESVNCIITSPPYWQLRDYGHDDQLGLESTPKAFIERLLAIFDEAKRVLKNDGACFVVIGDTYSYSGNKGTHTDPKRQKYVDGSMLDERDTPGMPRKCLVQIPSRFSIGMTDHGWILRNRIIWHKPNAMPDSVKDRFTIDYEDVFFFSKNEQYYFEQQKEPMKTTDLEQPRGSKGVIGNLNGGRRKQDELGKQTYTGFNQRYEAPDDFMRNKRCVWEIPTTPSSINHFAMFPQELIRPMILAGCPKDGMVLDMFSGSGTTGVVCKQENRSYIGIELNEEYAEIARKRIEGEAVQMKIDDFLDGIPHTIQPSTERKEHQ